MSKLNLTPEQFANYIAALMLDKMINMDSVISKNKEFTELMEDFKGMGGKSRLMKMYLDMPSEMRMKYKWTKKTLTGESDSIHTIRIIPESEEEKDKEKEGLVAKAIRKIKSAVGLGDSVNLTFDEAKLLQEIIEGDEDDGGISGEFSR